MSGSTASAYNSSFQACPCPTWSCLKPWSCSLPIFDGRKTELYMLNKPKFKEHFHVEVLEPKVVYLLSEKKHFALSGRLYAKLAPLLDGSHTVDEIVEQFEGQVTEADINYALTLLESKGYITEADEALPPEVAAFCHLLNVEPQVAAHRLQKTSVSVTAFGNIPIEQVISTLASLNIRVSDGGNCAVVFTDDYLQVGLDTFNREAYASEKPWLLVKPVGAVIWIGPIFRPGKTGCWQCLAQRLSGNREIESYLQKQKGIATPFPISRSVLPSTLQTGFNMAATEIVKWLISPDSHPQLEGKLITFDLVNLNLERHTLTRRPQCPCCGDPDYLHKQSPKPLMLNSYQKLLAAGGGYRHVLAEETLRRYEHHVSPITGVVRTLVNPLVGGNDLVHAYVANHSFPREGDELSDLRNVVRNKSFGKGKTDIQAKVGAMAEAIERYSGIYIGDEIRLVGKFSDMGDSIHPYALMHYSQAQYRDRSQWNQQHYSIQWVPEPFDEEQEIEWTPVWSLTAHKFKYVPTAYCYFGYPLPSNHCFCWADTNGNSAGNCQEEAILQGFMELVERDAVALWWYNRIPRRAVAIETFEEPYLRHLKIYYKTFHRDFWVLDITSDLNIPTFAAISRRTNKQPEDILFGFGAHFDPKIALIRAVTEMNQFVFLSNGANRLGNITVSRPDIKNWCETASIENQPYLAPDPKAAPKIYEQYPRYWKADLRDDVLNCVDIAAEHGLETLVLDQTRPDIGMSVVKVIVPGLRHFWAQFGSGRLYDVPVKLGWLSVPLTEEQLNPFPMFV